MAKVLVIAALIRILAGHHGVSPDYMSCIALHESDYRQDAVGAAGEIGTFQVLPSTGAWWVAKSGLSGDLNDTMANINLAAWAMAHGYRGHWSTDKLCEHLWEGTWKTTESR
jgi:soluble lytic murein transglycosylase-like protein